MFPAADNLGTATVTRKPVVPFILACAAALAMIFTGPATGNAQSVGSVSGTVVNGTEGGAVPSGLTVFFLATNELGALVHSGQTETGPNGEFSFPNVLLDGSRYLFRVPYSGVDYRQVVTSAEATTPVLEGVTLAVYETTHDVSVIQVSRQVLVVAGVDPKARMVSAIEFVRFSNTSDRTLQPDLAAAAPMMSFIRFSLPPQTSELNVNSDLPAGEVISVGTGFAVTSPITPGGHNVEFSFAFPYDGDSVSYRQNLLQGAAVYQLMIPEALSSIRVSALKPAAPVDIQGTPYKVWEIKDSASRQGFTLELTNLPQPSLADRVAANLSSAALWQIVIPVTLGAGLAVALVLGIVNRPRPATAQLGSGGGIETTSSEASSQGHPESREDLVLQLAVLDQRFESGQVPPEDYNSTRQALKERIMELTRATEFGMRPSPSDGG